MGYGLRYFIAAHDGALRRVPTARYHILPVRHQVREDGRLDASAAMRAALKRLEILERAGAGDARAQIEELEADANQFWWPTDAQLGVLGAALLKRTPSPDGLAELRAVVFKPGNSLRGQ